MRAGRPEDLKRLIDVWHADVREGRQDSAPTQSQMDRLLAMFDWEAKSRVVEGRDRSLTGAVLVSNRSTPQGVAASLHLAGGPEAAQDLARWGMGLAQAAGASSVDVFIGRDHGRFLADLGMRMVRPWWRMDRSLMDDLPKVDQPASYRLRDGYGTDSGLWAEMFSRSFADHWRFAPRSEQELLQDKVPELCLMAVAAGDGAPAAITLGQVETYERDRRPQPVGLVSSVGTVPEHRRRGLAAWLVAEMLVRLRGAGGSTASLYVDGWNTTNASNVYRKLGFEVAFEAEVWEATFP